jgi:hypothetical protein
LDALAVGDHDEEAGEHVAHCAACGRYVDAVSQGAAAFAKEKAAEADEFMRRVRAREAPASLVSRRALDATKPSRGTWFAGAATFLAAAACLLLVVRGRVPSVDDPEPKPLQGPVRLKGALSLNVVVERAGMQVRESGSLNLAPGDRVRLELALATDADLAAGILSDDGEWAELQTPTFFAAGTHFSDRSVFFQDDVPSGWLLAGAPSAIERARKTRDFAGLVVLRVRGRRP